MDVKALIIDDDPFIRDLLIDKLNQYLPEVNVLDTADSGKGGMAKIAQYQPNLIFLDVEMGDMTGFEMLSKLEDISFQTIFITSYSHYAIKAIRFNALDYLVKPIDLGDLKNSIKRFKARLADGYPATNVKQAIQNFKTKNVEDQILTLNTHDGELRLPLKNIIRLEGERNYSYIFLTNNKKKLASKPLGEFEDLLTEKGFFRSHKSHLINNQHIQSIPNPLTVKLSDGEEVPISRRKRDYFKEWYNQNNGSSE